MPVQAQVNTETLAAAETAFLQAYPGYEKTRLLDELRATEYARLDRRGQVYLDYTGGGLYAQSQLDRFFELLREGVYGNPHSQNPTSLAMTELVERARAYALEFFRADPDEYDLVFTPNASGALKLVGESFPFGPGSRYLPLYDNHNSVNGIREFARFKGARVRYVPTHLPDLRIDNAELLGELEKADPDAFNMFAYPAQSNFTGVQHNLNWIEAAQDHGWHVLLDAAAFAPTNRLDLGRWHPDFVPLSFYKMFGFPTGIGCLLARKKALARLQRPWFAGGTITITSVQGEGWHYLLDGHAAFEDGTINYLNIPAVEIGLRHLESIGVELIHERVCCLTGWLLDQLPELRHASGAPLVHIHGPRDLQGRGGTIAFSLDGPEGERLDYRVVEKLGNEAGISLRTGCFCNPGSGEIVHDLSREEMAQAFARDEAVQFSEFVEMAEQRFGKFPSSIRVSVGIASNFRDVEALLAFLKGFLDRPAAEVNALPLERKHTPDTA